MNLNKEVYARFECIGSPNDSKSILIATPTIEVLKSYIDWLSKIPFQRKATLVIATRPELLEGKRTTNDSLLEEMSDYLDNVLGNDEPELL